MKVTNVLFDKDLESVILGTILLENSAIARVGTLFRPEMFYVSRHQLTAELILKLYTQGRAIDIITVLDEAKKAKYDKEITPYDLTGYTRDVISNAHLEDHMLRLTELYMKREVQKLSGTSFSQAGEWQYDVFDIIEKLQKDLTNLLAGTLQGGLLPIDRLITKTLRQIDEIKEDVISGLILDLPAIDAIYYGFKPSELEIVAARPSCGKTALALQIVRRNAARGKRMALFALEMSYQQNIQRMLSAEAGIAFAKIQRNQLIDSERYLLNEAAARLSNMPIYIDDSFTQSVQVLQSKATQVMYKYGLDGIVVDYLQLIGTAKNAKDSSREQEISRISRGLKGMAKDLGLPVIALSQMSRDIEKRPKDNRQPQLSDLRESGAIEQDADTVLFLTPEENDIEEDNYGEPRIINATIAKQRNGTKAVVPLVFNGNYMRFEEKSA